METKLPGGFDGTPIKNEGPYLTAEEEQLTTDILRASRVIERVNVGQLWTPDFETLRRTNALPGTRRVRVEVVWNTPVDSSGPWSMVHCFGTRKIVHKQKWKQITRLATWVDLDARLVVGYGVTSEPEDVPQPVMGWVSIDSLGKVYDVETGDRILFGPLLTVPPQPIICPPNRYYRD